MIDFFGMIFAISSISLCLVGIEVTLGQDLPTTEEPDTSARTRGSKHQKPLNKSPAPTQSSTAAVMRSVRKFPADLK